MKIDRRSLQFAFSITIISLQLVLMPGCDRVSRSAEQRDDLARAFQQKESNVRVEGDGIVSRILSDDTSGISHQRFIVRLASGQTILIEHNTDVAGRIEDVKVGDTIRFLGEYVWNEQGGLVHWTHHDPSGIHRAGWIEHNGRTYQ